MTLEEQAIEAAAQSDAEFDGRPWNSLGRGEKERYKKRCKLSIEAYKSVIGQASTRF